MIREDMWVIYTGIWLQFLKYKPISFTKRIPKTYELNKNVSLTEFSRGLFSIIIYFNEETTNRTISTCLPLLWSRQTLAFNDKSRCNDHTHQFYQQWCNVWGISVLVFSYLLGRDPSSALNPFICEISQEESYKVVQDDRDFSRFITLSCQEFPRHDFKNC